MTHQTQLAASESVVLTPLPFHGHTLLTFAHKTDLRGRYDHAGHYVVLRPIVNALGLDWKSQYSRIMRDEVLSCVVVTTTCQLPGDNQKREHLCMPIDHMHGWLFGVSVKRVRPELRERLIVFKRECYRALYRHWHGLDAAPAIQSRKFWDRLRPHWRGIAELALAGLKNVQIAPRVARSAGSVGRCLRRMYEVGYLNPVEVFAARLKPATARRWAVSQPVALEWGRPALPGDAQMNLFTQEGRP